MIVRHKFTVLFLAVSVLLHLGLIGLLNRTKMQVPTHPKKSQRPIIKARLVFNQVVPVKKNKREQPKSTLKPIINKAVKAIDKKSISKSSLNKLAATANNRAPKINKSSSVSQSAAPSINDIYNATRNILNHNHQSALQTMQQATFNPYGTKPSLSDLVAKPLAHQYKKVEFNIDERRKTKIYCDSGLKQGIAVLSTWMGGTIACEKLPDLKQFMPKPKPKFKPYQ